MSTVPKHITRKLYRINELVYQAQELQGEVQEWIEKNCDIPCGDGWDYMVERSNTVADGYNVERLLDDIAKDRRTAWVK